MSWLGKVMGGTFGFMLGGPLGAILGTAVGHQFDKGKESAERLSYEPGDQQRIQMAFFTATFSVMGHIAKADGRVSVEEIKLAKSVMDKMDLTDNLRQTAMRLFSEGKSADFPLDAALDQFRRECHRSTNLMRMFIEIELQIAFADGVLSQAEEQLLLHICERLGFSRFQFQSLKAIFQAQQRFSGGWEEARKQAGVSTRPSLNDAYAVLGLKADATDSEVKRAYRRLISQHHPDKLVAKGLPEEMMKIATEKTQQIRKAYELIQKSRKR